MTWEVLALPFPAHFPFFFFFFLLTGERLGHVPVNVTELPPHCIPRIGLREMLQNDDTNLATIGLIYIMTTTTHTHKIRAEGRNQNCTTCFTRPIVPSLRGRTGRATGYSRALTETAPATCSAGVRPPPPPPLMSLPPPPTPPLSSGHGPPQPPVAAASQNFAAPAKRSSAADDT